MPFVLNGSIIEQTGTDTSLQGLDAIAGADSLLVGSGDNRKFVYSINNLTLRVEGTLTIDPEVEELITSKTSGQAVEIESGATLNIGKEITVNGVARYSYGMAIHHTSNESWNDGFLIQVSGGGTLNWYGGVVKTGGLSLNWISGSTINVFSQDAILLRDNVAGESQGQIRSNTTDYNQDGFTDVGANDIDDWFSYIGFWNKFKGYKPIHKKSAFSPSSSSSDAVYLAEDYDSSGGNTSDDLFWRNKAMEFRNPVNGSEMKFIGLSSGSTSVNSGMKKITSDLRMTSLEPDGTAIQGAKFYFTDFDNGDREDFTGVSAEDFVTDRSYSGTSDGSGVFAETNVLVMAAVRNNGVPGPAGTPDAGLNKYDYRSKNNNTDDLFDVNAIQYTKAILLQPVTLKGAGGVDLTLTMFPDNSVSESDKATVDAYTELETAQKAYDRAKAYLVDNYLGETETIVSREGDTLDAGSYDIEVDATAATAFAFDGSTVTIKADDFTNILKTTGTVTLLNGATASGGIIDSGGDSFLSFSGISGWTVYATESDANSDTNPVGSGTVSEVFRFNFSGGTTYYLRLATSSGAVIIQSVTPVESGETVVSLDTPSLLQSISSDIAELPTKTDLTVVNDGVQKASILVPHTTDLG